MEDVKEKEVASPLCRHGRQYDQYCYLCSSAGMQRQAEGIRRTVREDDK